MSNFWAKDFIPVSRGNFRPLRAVLIGWVEVFQDGIIHLTFLNKEKAMAISTRTKFFSILAVFALTGFWGCESRTVSRINPETQVDLSGNWNDTDAKLEKNFVLVEMAMA